MSFTAAVAAGSGHTIFLDTCGKVYGVGYNMYGQLGSECVERDEKNEKIIYKNKLELIEYFAKGSVSRVASIYAGCYHTIFLDTCGKVYAVGHNLFGQLGLGDKTSRHTPETIPYFADIPIASVTAGSFHTIFLDTSGKVYGVGDATGSHGRDEDETSNVIGYMGPRNNIPILEMSLRTTPAPIKYFEDIPIASVYSGNYHTIFLDTQGRVYATGYNFEGQIGLGYTSRIRTHVPIPYFANIPIASATCGCSHTIFLDTKGKVYAVGNNETGQLGLGDVTRRTTPTPIPFFANIPIASVSAGQTHTIFLDTSGKVYAVGNNKFGQLGIGLEYDDAGGNEGTEVCEAGDVGNEGCEVCKAGVACEAEKKKKYKTIPELITYFENIPISSICAGGEHTTFVDFAGKAYIVGHNHRGQLGLGSVSSVSTPQAIYI
jgi:alpha-tubulin suppressor-like RCC1 family protein